MTSRSTGNPKRVRRDSPEARAEFRGRILDAAFAAFHEKGEPGITMRLIAERVGTSQMTLYGYFTDRADLLRSLWQFIFAELADELEAACATKRNGRTRLMAVIEGWIGYWESRPDHYRLVYASAYDLMAERSTGVPPRPVYPRLAAVLLRVMGEFAAEANYPASRVKLASDVMLCQDIGYLHAVLTIGRYPWSERELLRKSIISATMLSIEHILGGR